MRFKRTAQKNAAFEAARVQSYLQSKDLLQKALQNSGLSAAEQAAVKDKVRTQGLAAAFGALSGLVQAAQQRAAQRTQRKENDLDPDEMTFLQKTYAGILKTANVIPSYSARETGNTAATQAALEAYRAGEREGYAAPSQPWWRRAKDWLEDKVEKFVWHPPGWLSVSYTLGEFSLGNYTAAHWISYQPSARNLWEGISYQQVEVTAGMKSTLTTNPKGIVDIDLSDGAITFNSGNSGIFVQPTALSFGWKSSNPPPGQSTANPVPVHKTVVDFDLFGKNMLSLKVSYAIGNEHSQVFNVKGTEVKQTTESEQKVTINVHRWPRIIAAAAVVYFVWSTATAVAPLAWEKAVAAGGAIWAWLQTTPFWQMIPGGR